ncbi:UDP-glucose 4-epimerase GalE [Sphingomonas sp. DBB INV C78]|uniref:UDP-glucose 4-epimerase GalE n=1 Tax=Sphingomonas sp. DBB INV C78 TaxID=3349434 RepID=UPI0036D3199E
MARSVLVTGGAGYIGSHAVLALLDAGYSVSVIDDFSTGFRSAVPDTCAFYQGDIADCALVERIIGERGIEAIMHFAGSIIVPESVTNPLKYYDNNTVKSRSLIAQAVEHNVRHFVFSSTAAVYGEPDRTPIDEDTPKQPINPYGSSKLMTEWMLRDTAAAHDFDYAVLRYFNVSGADPKGRTGQSTAGATHLIKVASEVIAGKRDGIAVFGTDYATRDGTAIRDYIHVSDLADAHVLALDRLFDAPGQSLLFNCGYGNGFSVTEVLDAVEQVAGTSVNRRLEGRRPGDPPALVADSGKIRAALGWTPRHDDLATIVAHALAWERNGRAR